MLTAIAPPKPDIRTSNLPAVGADTTLQREIFNTLNNFFKNGFPETAESLKSLSDTLNLRQMYLDEGATETLSLGKPHDQFLDLLRKNLENPASADLLNKVKLLNHCLATGDADAQNYVMMHFADRGYDHLKLAVQRHQNFSEICHRAVTQHSNLPLEEQALLVIRRNDLAQRLADEGLSKVDAGKQADRLFLIAEELSDLHVNVLQIHTLLGISNKHTPNHTMSLRQTVNFLESVYQLQQQDPAPPLGMARYLHSIITGSGDMTGNMQEAIVAARMQRQGWKICELSREVRNPSTEIDIIAQKGSEKFFIEVKSTLGTLIHKNKQPKSGQNQLSKSAEHASRAGAKLGITCLSEENIQPYYALQALRQALSDIPHGQGNSHLIDRHGVVSKID